MSMDQAIYDPGTGFIFGVRNQWIYKCSAVDGSILSSFRFTTNANYPSCITSLNGKLYCGVLSTPLNNFVAGQSADRDIFVVDAATFAPAGRLNIGTTFGSTVQAAIFSGYMAITNDGTHIAVWNFGNNSTPNVHGFATFDPTNIAGTIRDNFFNSVCDVAYDSFNGVYWVTDNQGDELWVIITYPTDSVGGRWSYNSPNVTGLQGVTYNAAQNKVYTVTGSEQIYMTNAATAMAFVNPGGTNFGPLGTTLHTNRINANPCRIKSCNNFPGNPYNGKVLIPAYADDTVLVWNPATDNVADMVVKTGFISPMDIVHCPTASFAVQNNTLSLKMIT